MRNIYYVLIGALSLHFAFLLPYVYSSVDSNRQIYSFLYFIFFLCSRRFYITHVLFFSFCVPFTWRDFIFRLFFGYGLFFCRRCVNMWAFIAHHFVLLYRVQEQKNINKCNSFECFHYLLDELIPYVILLNFFSFFFFCVLFSPCGSHCCHRLSINLAIIQHGKMHFGAHFSVTTWDRLFFSHLWHGFSDQYTMKPFENWLTHNYRSIWFEWLHMPINKIKKNGNWKQTEFKACLINISR